MSNSTTTPEEGRHVHYVPLIGSDDGFLRPGKPHAAIICEVLSPNFVNLSVCDRNGRWHPKTQVHLRSPGEEVPAGRDYCQWMPYHLDKAAAEKAEADREPLADTRAQIDSTPTGNAKDPPPVDKGGKKK